MYVLLSIAWRVKRRDRRQGEHVECVYSPCWLLNRQYAAWKKLGKSQAEDTERDAYHWKPLSNMHSPVSTGCDIYTPTSQVFYFQH